MKDKIRERLNENISRVKSLVGIYRKLGNGPGRRGTDEADILRSSVVFLHASLEDFLRSLALWKHPITDDNETLNKYPFLGSMPGNRVEKINLGFLIAHREKKVGDVIAESVEQYLERETYNNTDEISKLLISLKVPLDDVSGLFSNLSELMKRRHAIVHKADRKEMRGRGNHKFETISPALVEEWIRTVNSFATKVLELLN